MKVLAIDAGNTRIKWGWARDRKWEQLAAIPRADVERLREAFTGLPRPECVIVSNVAGAAVQASLAAAVAPFRVEPQWVKGKAFQCGVRSGYDDPEQLGPDRWAALIGAWQLFGGPCLVANAGTTLTVDALSADGIFIGGFIVPGIELMRSALAQHTARLQFEEGRFAYFPDRTADAILSGAINALVGSIECMLHFMEETGQTVSLVVLSGGAAAELAPRLNARLQVVEHLVLEGLLCIAAGPSA